MVTRTARDASIEDDNVPDEPSQVEDDVTEEDSWSGVSWAMTSSILVSRGEGWVDPFCTPDGSGSTMSDCKAASFMTLFDDVTPGLSTGADGQDWGDCRVEAWGECLQSFSSIVITTEEDRGNTVTVADGFDPGA